MRDRLAESTPATTRSSGRSPSSSSSWPCWPSSTCSSASGRWAWQTYDARRRPEPPPEEVEFDVLEGPRRLAEEITRDAAEQRRVLLEGSPRNAIVECWHRFEQQAAEAGLERHPWETSSEFTLRMLDLVAADSGAVAELAVLYREARFSTHSLDEAARERAVADLDAIHAGLLAGRGWRT